MHPSLATVATLAVAVIVCGAERAVAQSYNIDFGGAGSVPSIGYAAAGLPGRWNNIGVPVPGTNYPLVNLASQSLGATLNNIGGTQLLINNDPATSGNDAALMDDMLIGFNDPVDVCIWIKNLQNGPYEVLMYAMTPSDPSLMSRTRVDFADQGPTFVGGAWPGEHQLDVTYSRHTVTVTNGTIGLHSGLFDGDIQSGINGIQIRRLVEGDFDGDGLVNGSDLAILLALGGHAAAAKQM